MKSILIFAGIAGVVVAAALYYSILQSPESGQVINVEDGFPVDV
ncbi:MAG: hypothetical protein JWQ40_952 [Segetibacter sp.]|jgi:hypothetical protein|nr:hypothetical protein [Segetibacter sp.]